MNLIDIKKYINFSNRTEIELKIVKDILNDYKTLSIILDDFFTISDFQVIISHYPLKNIGMSDVLVDFKKTFFDTNLNTCVEIISIERDANKSIYLENVLSIVEKNVWKTDLSKVMGQHNLISVFNHFICNMCDPLQNNIYEDDFLKEGGLDFIIENKFTHYEAKWILDVVEDGFNPLGKINKSNIEYIYYIKNMYEHHIWTNQNDAINFKDYPLINYIEDLGPKLWAETFFINEKREKINDQKKNIVIKINALFNEFKIDSI